MCIPLKGRLEQRALPEALGDTRRVTSLECLGARAPVLYIYFMWLSLDLASWCPEQEVYIVCVCVCGRDWSDLAQWAGREGR